MFNHKYKKGIMLVTTLLITGFLVMLAAATMFSSNRQIYVASKYYQRESAYQVALAGINYAFTRLSEDPEWEGCIRNGEGTGVGGGYTLDKGSDLVVKEYPILGNRGCVEGAIKVGENTGYFDIYFVNPDLCEGDVTYFGNKKPGGELPKWIPVSYNNFGNSFEPDTKDANGDSYKTVPRNSILIACRGVMGNQTKIVETCIELNPAKDDTSVLLSGNDTILSISDSDGNIHINGGSTNKPPIVRSNRNLSLEKAIGNPDYLLIDNEGGAVVNEIVKFPEMEPSNYISSLNGGAGCQMDYLESTKLTISDVMPETAGFASIKPGIYTFKRDYRDSTLAQRIKANKYPIVAYYNTTDTQELEDLNCIPEIIENNEIKRLIDLGVFEWNKTDGILNLKKSLKVGTAIGNDGEVMKDLLFYHTKNTDYTYFYQSENDRMRIKLRSDMEGENPEVVYLVNDNENGLINVDGELSGDGTVISCGSIEMEVESALSAVDVNSGLSIFAEGDIKINRIRQIAISNGNNFIPVVYGMGTSTAEQNYRAFEFCVKPEHASQFPIVQGGPLFAYFNRLKDLGFIPDGDTQYTPSSQDIAFFQQAMDNGGYEVFSDLPDGQEEPVIEINGQEVTRRDSYFKGLVYTLKNFIVDTDDTGFFLQGGMVAYSDNPAPQGEDADKGNINIRASKINLNYDTSLLSLIRDTEDMSITSHYWGSYSSKD